MIRIRVDQRAPRVRQIDQRAAVQPALAREAQREPQRMIARAERQRRAKRARELQALEHGFEARAARADSRARRYPRIVERDAADIGAADAVRALLRQRAKAALGQCVLVDEQHVEAAGAAFAPRAGEQADHVAARRVVDQPFLAGDPVFVAVGFGIRIAAQQIAAVLALGQPPRYDRAVAYPAREARRLLVRRAHPHANRAEKSLAVADRDGQVAAREHPDQLQRLLEIAQHAAEPLGHVIAMQPPLGQHRADGVGKALVRIQLRASRV
ncbi:hypothetical protein DO70_4691 [Burkholderia pseudomallei]|nr:hypothetical protein DO70_4691 [Burkholderia pseudomallei]